MATSEEKGIDDMPDIEEMRQQAKDGFVHPAAIRKLRAMKAQVKSSQCGCADCGGGSESPQPIAPACAPIFETENEFWAALKHDRKVEHEFMVANSGDYPDWWLKEPEWEPDGDLGTFAGGDLMSFPEDFLGAIGELLDLEYGQLATVRITIEIIDEPHEPWDIGRSSSEYGT